MPILAVLVTQQIVVLAHLQGHGALLDALDAPDGPGCGFRLRTLTPSRTEARVEPVASRRLKTVIWEITAEGRDAEDLG